MQHLESEIARLETALLQDGQLEVVHASDILLGMPGQDVGQQAQKLPEAPAAGQTHQIAQVDAASYQAHTGTHPAVNGLHLDSTHILDNIDPSLHDALHHDALHTIYDLAPPPPTESPLRAAIIGSRSLQSFISATLPHRMGKAADLLSRVRMGLTPSMAKVREREGGRTTTVRASRPRPTTDRLQAPILRSMPWDIVLRLMRKYLNTIQSDNPFLVVPTVLQQFDNVEAVLRETAQPLPAPLPAPSPDTATSNPPLSVPPSHDFLVVYLILAISVTLGSANDGHEDRCMALSVSLFEEGIQHLYSLTAFPSEMAWLQTILQVLLYATVFPRAANVWVLSGVAMRSCLELGLHREQPHSTPSGDDDSGESAALRRRVFWSAYCLDRQICSALQRPLSTPDAAIDTCLPLPTNPAAPPQTDPFLAYITYNRLYSEILHIHFQREPLPAPLSSWDDWVADMEGRLHRWHAATSEAHTPYSNTQHDFQVARGLMELHRPSPRVPLPAPASLLRAFEAATASERIHSGHLREGMFRRPWLSAHFTLEAATVVLFCLRHGYHAIAERFSAAQIFDGAKLITSNLLAIAARSWPEVGIYAGVYERLLGPLLERVFARGADLDMSRFGPAEDAELMRLLYPGPAHLDVLRFGLRQKQPQPSPQVELSPFDFNLFMLDDNEMWQAGLLEDERMI